MEKGLILGCIADDFTGGSDAASFLAAGGMNTILLAEIPEEGFELPQEIEAAVITLKSRTQETKAAVEDSLAAIRWLKNAGASRFYIKYCSTFDSTPRGNIGPIVDAVLEELDVEGTILCPALPANERIVKDGILYVKGLPLAQSPMKDHPLTPMWESRISLLMKPQGKYESLELHGTDLAAPDEEICAKVQSFAAKTAASRKEKATAEITGIAADTENTANGKNHWYLIPDYVTDEDAYRIVDLFGDMTVLTGGSGILTALGEKLKTRDAGALAYVGTQGPAILVAGSCSVATHAQTTWYESQGAPSYRLSDEGIAAGTENFRAIWEKMGTYDAPLIYSYDTPEGLKKKHNEAGRQLAEKIEDILAQTVAYAMQHGVTRIIVAGGETSGAVTKALGYKAYHIGKSVAPGVPVMTPVENPAIRLVLKSGNFGQEDFFGSALQLTKV